MTPAAAGVIAFPGTGSLTMGGRPLTSYAHAAVAAAGLPTFDAREFAQLEPDRVVMLHDAACPLTPPEFLAEVAGLVAATGVVHVGARPVTDTVKSVEEYGGAAVVGETVDRQQLWSVASPLAGPAVLLRDAVAQTGLDDLPELVRWLLPRVEVRFVEAPALGRRVTDLSAVELLEALAAL